MDPNIVLYVALAAMIVLMVFNNRKRKKAAAELQQAIQPGATVMLTSGIYGNVVSIDDARAVIETTPGTKLTVNRLAIRQVETSFSLETSAAKAATKAAVAKAPAAKKPAAKPATKKPAAKK
ncbi:MAG: hypothetical protein RLZZ164_958 [Actinomycetota bacterium]|jgi:preprotein translocase subunit YajC